MRRIVPMAAMTVVAAATVAGCERGRETRTEETAAVPPATVAAPAAPATPTAGSLTRRSEAQDHFDRARQAFVQRDLATVDSELRAAATFLRQRADSASGETREHLAASARELERMAGEVDRKAVQSETALDHAFARANRAEAERHHATALDAWSKREATRAGEELTMAADHLERAARDAGEELDAGTRTALADTRTVARELMEGAAAAPETVKKATDALAHSIHRIGARIERRRG